ncbi:hypothetical protein E0L36_21380 [Streptomyces sp. AJS327]|uniref:hypothetical protein n=1 Tax=Streptomyces sp. AJS327 TaxID=2545265 RepID=UPI0015DFAA38|nr:hypothetical protein [Streptomyces sp. AJS327]MBA0053332.1 hypothetical protein [Streptomyces sp. AJS327]
MRTSLRVVEHLVDVPRRQDVPHVLDVEGAAVEGLHDAGPPLPGGAARPALPAAGDGTFLPCGAETRTAVEHRLPVAS